MNCTISMRDFTSEFPHVANFVGVFFNQDYRSFGRNTAEVIDSFRKEVDPVGRRRVLQDIDRFLQNVPKEDDVAVALRQFGLDYDVIRAEQLTKLAWVRELRRLINDSLVN